MRAVPTVSGRTWEFSHNGTDYQIVTLHGSTAVRLYYRDPIYEKWNFGHARDTNGQSAKLIADQMHEDIVAPIGTQYAREWLPTATVYTAVEVRAMSNEYVCAAIDGCYPGGWDGMLRAIGAV